MPVSVLKYPQTDSDHHCSPLGLKRASTASGDSRIEWMGTTGRPRRYARRQTVQCCARLLEGSDVPPDRFKQQTVDPGQWVDRLQDALADGLGEDCGSRVILFQRPETV